MILSPPGSEYSPQAWKLTEVPPENLDGDWKTSWFRERLVPDRCYKACLENIGKYHFFKGNCCGLALWGVSSWWKSRSATCFPGACFPLPLFFFGRFLLREVFLAMYATYFRSSRPNPPSGPSGSGAVEEWNLVKNMRLEDCKENVGKWLISPNSMEWNLVSLIGGIGSI